MSRLHNHFAFEQELVGAFTYSILLLVHLFKCIEDGAVLFSAFVPDHRHAERGLTIGGKASLIPCDLGMTFNA
ncbi:hypothetical protein [Bilophila sp.]|uniref:hypothetical protein n=1 Tax=Bilophila sp. TaxID=1929485 RepID=UPI0030784D03